MSSWDLDEAKCNIDDEDCDIIIGAGYGNGGNEDGPYNIELYIESPTKDLDFPIMYFNTKQLEEFIESL